MAVSRALRRWAAAGFCAVLACAWALAPTASVAGTSGQSAGPEVSAEGQSVLAQSAGPEAPAAGGEPVTGGTGAGDALELEPGSYADSLTADANATRPSALSTQDPQARTYRITLAEGQQAYLSASLLRPPGDGSDAIGTSASLRLTISSAIDATCTIRQQASARFGQPGLPVFASADTGVIGANNPHGSCFQYPGEFIVAVAWIERGSNLPETLPLELQYVRQAEATWSKLPEPEDDPPIPPFLTTPADEGSPVEPGSTFNTAVALRGRVSEVELGADEYAFFRVPVAAGQQLRLRADAAGPDGRTVALSLYDPNLRPVAIVRPGETGAPPTDLPAAKGSGNEAGIDVAGGRAATALTMRYPINPKRAFGQDQDARSSSLAGEYYLLVHVAAKPYDDDTGRRTPLRISRTDDIGAALPDAPEVEGTGQADVAFGLPLGELVRYGGLGGGAAFLLVSGVFAVLAIRRARR